MMFLSKNGVFVDQIDNTDFYFEIPSYDSTHSFKYPGDSIVTDIDDVCAGLFLVFKRLIFSEKDDRASGSMPIFVYESGCTSESCISKEMFDVFLNRFSSYPLINEHLYLADCNSIISSLQSTMIGLNWDFFNFYMSLSEVSPFVSYKDTVAWVMSQKAELSFSILTSYFIKAYSMLDLLTKIAFELENIHSDFSVYKKLNCRKVLWGDRKNLIHKFNNNTVFSPDDTIRTIESLRNELVHNANWETNNRVFIKYEDDVITERWICFPDLHDGRLIKYVNRNRFYSQNNKVNDLLPKIHLTFLEKVKHTIKLLNSV